MAKATKKAVKATAKKPVRKAVKPVAKRKIGTGRAKAPSAKTAKAR
jgi:hypothetical protein